MSKAGETTSNFIKDLPPFAKGVIAIGILFGIGFIGYKIYKGVQKGSTLKGSKEELDASKSEAQRLNSDPKTKATLTQAQMAIYADSLFAAMDGYGSDLTAIYKVFANVNNDADLLGIISAFGIRKISSGRLNPEPDFEGSLGGAITNELDNDQVKALNFMLSKKGIKYRF